MWWCTVLLCSDTCTNNTFEESSEENLSCVRRKEHLSKPDAFWKQVLWTSEVQLELFGHNEERYVCRKRVFLSKNTSPTVIHRVGSITLWVCVVVSGTGNISLLEGRMDSIKYQYILEANITPSVKKLRTKHSSYKRIMILNPPQDPQWTTCGGTSWRFSHGPPSPPT